MGTQNPSCVLARAHARAGLGQNQSQKSDDYGSGAGGRVHFAVGIHLPLSRLTGICVCDVEMYTPPIAIPAPVPGREHPLPCSTSDQLIPHSICRELACRPRLPLPVPA
jgi:hypothetical protein